MTGVQTCALPIFFVFKLNISPTCFIPSGVFLDLAPFPPLRYIPCSSGLNEIFRAPNVPISRSHIYLFREYSVCAPALISSRGVLTARTHVFNDGIMNAFQRAFGCTDLIEVNAESARSGFFTFSGYKYDILNSAQLPRGSSDSGAPPG